MIKRKANMNLGKVVKFTNITDKDFTHPFDGQPFSVKAGEIVLLPFDLADHLATHLARKIMIDGDKSPTQYDPKDDSGGRGKPLISAEKEQELKGRILGDVSDAPTEKVKSETEVLRERIDELNKRFDVNVAPPIPEPTLDLAELAQDGLSLAVGYRDKAEVIAELKKRQIVFDARQSKTKLEVLLK
jgi:hypothetical protein